MKQVENTILFDGAFGTYYAFLTGKQSFCELASFDDKETVIKIHKEYIDAGANAIKTNTFGANTFSLNCDFKIVESLIHGSWELAEKAIDGREVRIFADIGPISSDQMEDEYFRILDVFLNLGAKDFLFETFAESTTIIQLIKYIRTKLPDAFIISSFAVDQEGYSKKGHYYKKLIKDSSTVADCVGLNCICGPAHMSKLMKSLEIDDCNLSSMPNSGYPTLIGSRTVYIDNAEYFASKMKEISDSGVKILGGCCGTTPLHINALAQLLAQTSLPTLKHHLEAKKVRTQKSISNSLSDKLISSKKVIAVELGSPVDLNCEYLYKGAKMYKDAGADAITFADSPLARTRADSLMISSLIKREHNISVIPHLTCRDRNLIGIKSALIGAKIEGLQNVFIVTGDPISKTEREVVKGIYNLNSLNMIEHITNLNEDMFSTSPYFIGAALNLNALNFEAELSRAVKKDENGAHFFMTQPVFSEIAISNLKLARLALKAKILTGLMPLAGYRNAVFINNEVSGINIPNQLIESYKDKNPEESQAISIDFTIEQARHALPYCDGFYIITPLNKTEMVCKLIKELRRIIQ